ncbi:hypothetical protein F480_07615 [Bibersteinia trehalosi Y31]|uniref:Uncharacterized protein n=1 Tax=Bibersteinia trehalosi Y31 TaxID=1261658 RepID=A0A179CYC5_BIBTR|nr:hypothetical protein [Bibersteinia trehalosi]OAQ14913.1 hypothetical protein F480_07615 [Bibersteinia trehalosi Y31]
MESANRAVIGFNNYRAGHLSGNLGNRAFSFGSSEFKLDTENISYRVTKSGKKFVENIKITPKEDNFDYSSNNKFASLLNPALEKIYSNNKPKNTVQIKFIPDLNQYRNTYSQADYAKDKAFIARGHNHLSDILNFSTHFISRGTIPTNANPLADVSAMAFKLWSARNEKPNIKANNPLSFSSQPNPKLDANSDAVVISRSRKAIVNKHTLNQHSDPASVAKSFIITDDMRVLIKTLPNLLNS